MQIIELSMELGPKTKPFPGNPAISITEAETLKTNGVAVSNLKISSHSGTHVDFPKHFLENGANKSTIPLEQFVGDCVIIPVLGLKEIKVADVVKFEKEIVEHRRVFFRTDWNKDVEKETCWKDNPVLTNELAVWLVEKKVEVVGIDSFGVDNDPYEVHKILLKNKVVIVENLINLHKILDNVVDVIIAPLNLNCEDGAPARVWAMVK